jgi:hypothetical protein
MRRLTLVHSELALVFNIAILALSITIIASVGQDAAADACDLLFVIARSTPAIEAIRRQRGQARVPHMAASREVVVLRTVTGELTIASPR